MRQEIRYGKKIVELRRARGWTQEHLAEAAELEVRTIQRAEKDETKSAETLQAIAGAFDVDLAHMRTVRLIPEHRFLRAELVTSYRQFLSLETAHRSEMFSKVILTELDAKSADIEELWDQVFSDWDVISPDDFDLWQAYCADVKEPINALFDRGFAIFTVDEYSESILRPVAGIVPERPWIDWIVRHHALVNRHGCHKTAGKLHRFDVACKEGSAEFLEGIRNRKGEMLVWPNAVFPAFGPAHDSFSWCDECFPPKEGRLRVDEDYIAAIMGLSVNELRQIIAVQAERAGEDSLYGLS
jgi:transcriptional regulator with XRE-family HTH domain